MIQRKQSLYMLFVALINGITVLFSSQIEAYFTSFARYIIILLLTVCVLSLINISLYKKRPLQIKINYLSMVLSILLIGLMGYDLLMSSGGVSPEKGVFLLIPVIDLIFLGMANQCIKKDEKLIKSIDRFR